MATVKYFDEETLTWKALTQGKEGVGVPSGGNDGDILTKDGSTNYETEWTSPNSIRDKNYTTSFTVSDEITVSHNLNKYPSVTIIDTAGDTVEGDVYHSTVNELIVRFTNPFSGIITCN